MRRRQHVEFRIRHFDWPELRSSVGEAPEQSADQEARQRGDAGREQNEESPDMFSHAGGRTHHPGQSQGNRRGEHGQAQQTNPDTNPKRKRGNWLSQRGEVTVQLHRAYGTVTEHRITRPVHAWTHAKGDNGLLPAKRFI